MIKLTCSVTDSGNPQANFKWSKDGMDKGHTNQGYYTISAGQLSVSGHDGLWKCTPSNVIGDGEPDTINITVYGKFYNNLLYHIITNLLYCGFIIYYIYCYII